MQDTSIDLTLPPALAPLAALGADLPSHPEPVALGRRLLQQLVRCMASAELGCCTMTKPGSATYVCSQSHLPQIVTGPLPVQPMSTVPEEEVVVPASAPKPYPPLGALQLPVSL